MHPILIDFGTHALPFFGTRHLFLPTYGLLYAAGVLVAWWWLVRRATALRVSVEDAFNLGFYALLAGIFGAKLALLALEWRYYLQYPKEILGVFTLAGVLMGGVVAGAIAFVAYAWRRKLPIRQLGDAVAAPLALAQGIGRLGCLAAGCCYGRPSEGLWCAITFADPLAHERTGVPLGVPLWPTQPVQAAADLALAGVLTWLYRRKSLPAGSVFWTYVVLYGLTRGTVEFFRGDDARGLWLGGAVSTSQILSALAIVLGLAMLVAGRVRRRPATKP